MSENSRSGLSGRRGPRGNRSRGRGGRQSGSGRNEGPGEQTGLGTTDIRGRGSSRSRGPSRQPNTRTSQRSATDDSDKVKLVRKAITDISPGDVIYDRTPGLKEMNEKIDWVYGSTNPDKHDQIVLVKDEVNQELVTVLLTSIGSMGENENETSIWARWNSRKCSREDWGKGLVNLATVEPKHPLPSDISEFKQPAYTIKYDKTTEFRYNSLMHWANVAHAFRIEPSTSDACYAVRDGMKFSPESVKNVIKSVIKRDYDEDVKAMLREPPKDRESTSLEIYIKEKKKRGSKEEKAPATETGEPATTLEGGPHKKNSSWAKVAEKGHELSQPPALPTRAKDRRDLDKGPTFVQPSLPPSGTMSWAQRSGDAEASKSVNVSGKTSGGVATPATSTSASNTNQSTSRSNRRNVRGTTRTSESPKPLDRRQDTGGPQRGGAPEGQKQKRWADI